MVPPPGDEVEAEMVAGSQRRMSSAPSIQVTFKCDVERILSTSTSTSTFNVQLKPKLSTSTSNFQMMPPTVDVDADDKAEGRKSSATSIQVIFKSETAREGGILIIFNFSDDAISRE